MRDGAEQAIHCADNVVQNVRHVVEGVDEERIEVQGLEDAVDDVDQVAETDDELQLSFHVCDREIDLLDSDLHAGVELNQIGDFGVQVDIGLEILNGCEK